MLASLSVEDTCSEKYIVPHQAAKVLISGTQTIVVSRISFGV